MGMPSKPDLALQCHSDSHCVQGFWLFCLLSIDQSKQKLYLEANKNSDKDCHGTVLLNICVEVFFIV